MSAVSPPEQPNDAALPLVVDVDGTLIAGDLSVESAVRFVSTLPLRSLAFPFWILLGGGRAALKHRIACRVALPPATLALNPSVVAEIDAARAKGREVWLASGSDERVVAPLAGAVGATGHIASDGRTAAKATLLVERFGEGGFDYIGNERRDLAVWKHARKAVGVGLSARLRKEVRALDSTARFLPKPGGPVDYFRALRPHQWVKNVLVCVPLAAAHEASLTHWASAGVLFAVFCALASGTYLINDILDLPHDRRHASKRHRPIAAGKAPLLPMAVVAAALMAGGLAAVFQLSAAAGQVSLLYLAGTFAYSLWIKRLIFVDVVVLAMLYTVRILAGSAAASITLSPWFLSFFAFFFLFLAIAKRLAELCALREAGRAEADGRAYRVDDFPVMAALGATSGFSALVVFSLYISSSRVNELYGRPEFLWLALPPLIYWLGRTLLLANRGKIDDPVVFALCDRAAWLTGVVVAAGFVAAL